MYFQLFNIFPLVFLVLEIKLKMLKVHKQMDGQMTDNR